MFKSNKSAGFSMVDARRDRRVRLAQLDHIQRDAKELVDEIMHLGVVIVSDGRIASAVKGLVRGRRDIRWQNEPGRTIFGLVR